MDNIIPIFPIESLDNDRYPGVKRRYLTEDPELVNYNLLDLSSILSSKETRQQALGLPSLSPTTTVNYAYNAQAQHTPTGRPQPCTSHPPPPTSYTDYPPPRGVPWKCIASMLRSDTSCTVCHFNKPNDSSLPQVTPRGWMPSLGEARIHIPEGGHGVNDNRHQIQ